VDFFDDEDDAPKRPRQRGDESRPATAGAEPLSRGSSRGGGSGGAHPPDRQQIRLRQAGLAIGAIVMLILIVIAFRGCLNARSDRAFENYVSDLSSIAADSNALSTDFFRVLDAAAAGEESEISLTQTLDGYRGTSQGLLDRAAGLDAPGEVEGAQEQIVLAFELRRDAIAGIANQADQLGGDLQEDAAAAIYTQMKVLSASDILYARARDQIEQALEDAEIVIPDGVPESQFIPDAGKGVPDYLDPAVVEDAFTSAAGGSSGTTSNADCQGDGETHGLGLVGSTLQPSGTALAPGTAVTAPSGDDAIEVQVQNQGSADEAGVDVTVESDTGISGSDTIDQIDASATETATIRLNPVPGAGETATLDVDVATVGCEQVADNNVASYPITF